MAIVLFRVFQVVYPKIPNLVPTAIVFIFGALVPVQARLVYLCRSLHMAIVVHVCQAASQAPLFD